MDKEIDKKNIDDIKNDEINKMNEKEKKEENVTNNNNNNNNKNNNNKQNQNKQQQKQNDGNQFVNKSLSDTYKRINFLYQASSLMLHTTNNQPISNFYSKTLKRIAQKQVIHVNPSIKRTLCKKCCALLVPGHTSTVRIQETRESHTVITCNNCKKVKRFNINKKNRNKFDKSQLQQQPQQQ